MRRPSAIVSLQPSATVQLPSPPVHREFKTATARPDIPGTGGALVGLGAQLAARRRVGRVGAVGCAGRRELGPREAVLGRGLGGAGGGDQGRGRAAGVLGCGRGRVAGGGGESCGDCVGCEAGFGAGCVGVSVGCVCGVGAGFAGGDVGGGLAVGGGGRYGHGAFGLVILAGVDAGASRGVAVVVGGVDGGRWLGGTGRRDVSFDFGMGPQRVRTLRSRSLSL
jgi:hypothetical protein